MTELEEFTIDERTQKKVWRSLGVKSLKQIADETGLTRDQVIRLRTELLDSIDVLTEQQARTKLLKELEDMVYEARDRADKSSDEFYSGMMNSAISAIKAIQAERQRMSKENQDAITALNTLRKKEIIKMYVGVVDSGVAEIAETYGLEEDELFEVFNRHLSEFKEEL